MTPDDPAAEVAEDYRAFARWEARGRSAAYESLAESAAGDAGLMSFVASLRAGQAPAQPAVRGRALPARHPAGLAELRDLVGGSGAQLTEVLLSRRTQTNEPARCAALLPALAQLPPPLALIEVGASAGLTLLVDRYSYDYAGHRLAGRDPQAPTLRCEPRGPVPLPAGFPRSSGGPGSTSTRSMSTTTTTCAGCPAWSGRVRATGSNGWPPRSRSARRDPPVVHRGDLLTDLPALAAQAPADATLVVYHTSVLGLRRPGRAGAVLRHGR